MQVILKHIMTIHIVYFIYSSEDGDAKIDEAEEVRSGDEEAVEPEEEPEGIIKCLGRYKKVSNHVHE